MYEHGDNKSSIEAAAEAAHKVNAMLIAKGKLKPSQLTQNPLPKPRQALSTNQFFAEVCINDVPAQVRNMLTRGNTQEEISKGSSAAVSTRGRYMTKTDKAKHPNEKPLYLSVQGPDQCSVDAAVRRIHSMIETHMTRQVVYKENRFLRQMEGFGLPSNSSALLNENIVSGGLLSHRLSDGNGRLDSGLVSSPLASSARLEGRAMSSLDSSIVRFTSARGLNTSCLSINTIPSVNPLLLEEKVYVGMEGAPESFALKDKILGPGGSYLQHIAVETGAKVMLRGKGSGHLETSAGMETPEPMHIYLQHERITGLQQSKDLSNNLLQTIREEYQSQMLAMVTPGTSLLSTVPFISGSGMITGSSVLTSGMTSQGLQQALLHPVSSGVLLTTHTTPLVSQVALADPGLQQTIITQQPALLIPPPDAARLSLPPPQIVQPSQMVVPHTGGCYNVQQAPLALLNPMGAQLGAARQVQELTDEQKLLQLQLTALSQQHLVQQQGLHHQNKLSASHHMSVSQPVLQAVPAPTVSHPLQVGQRQILHQAPVGHHITPQIGPINVPPPTIHVSGAHLQHVHALGQDTASSQLMQQSAVINPVQRVLAQPIVHPAPVQAPVSMAPLTPVQQLVRASAPPTPVQQLVRAPVPSGLSYEHYIKREKEKRRFTEEKDMDRMIPDNLLGYQHGPPHLVNLTTPSSSSAPRSATSLTTSVAMCGPGDGSHKDMDLSGNNKSLLKRPKTTGITSPLLAKKTKDALGNITEYVTEEQQEVEPADSKLHETVSKCTFNQYTGQPQLYQQTSHAGPHCTQTSVDQAQYGTVTLTGSHGQYSTPSVQYCDADGHYQPTQYATVYSEPNAFSQGSGVQYDVVYSQPATYTPISSYSQLQTSSVVYTPVTSVPVSKGAQTYSQTLYPVASASAEYSAPYRETYQAPRPRYTVPPPYGAQTHYATSSIPPPQ